MKTFQTEQGVRTLVDEQLKNLGWDLVNGKKCNVFQETTRTVEERKKLKGKRPDYVLYSSDCDIKEPIAIIETKKPGENLDEAIIQGCEYANILGVNIVFATDGIYYKTLHTKINKPLILNGDEVDELIREFEILKFIENNEVNTISEEVIYDRKQLIRIFEDSNDLLRDEGFRAGIERFGEFSNILFLKLIGEIEDLKEKNGEKTILDKHLRWSNWKEKMGKDLLSHINKIVLPEIGDLYEDKDIFTELTIQNPETLTKIIEKLDPLNLINIDSDIKGDSFEYFLKQSTATKNDLGEYFTPRHIVKLMVKLLNPQIGETIYDPFCGTGGTLIETFKYVSRGMARTKRNWKQLKENTLFGNEITTTARITKMNMILIGDGHSGIQQKNSLKNPVEGGAEDNGYDIVITNMPYSQKTEYGSYYDLPSTNGDSICIQHCIKAIDKTSENGRMALVVPEGFLFRKDLQKTREYLLDRCTLQSVISLPQGVFLPYTGVKTNILYCTNVKQKKTQEYFWYFDVKNDGFSLDSHRTKIEGKNDLQKFLEYRNPEKQDSDDLLKLGFSKIYMEEVKKNNLVLVGSRYKKMFDYGSVVWKLTKISDIAKVGAGNSAPQNQDFFKNGKYPFFRTSDVAVSHITTSLTKSRDKLNEKGVEKLRLITKNTILIPKSGASTFLNHRSILGVDGYVSSHLATIEANEEKILTKFLFYILCNVDSKKLTINQNYPSLKLSDIENFKFPLPPIKVQKEIVKELDNYSKIIEGARQIIKNYKPNIEINNKWEKIKLGKICKYEGGTQPPKSTFKNSHREDYIRLLQIRDYKSDNRAVYIPMKERHKTCNETDIMIGRYGPPVFQILKGKKGAYNVALIKTIPNEKKLLKGWLYYFLISDSVQKHIISLSERARQSGVSPRDLDELEIALPSIKKQKEIIESIRNEEILLYQNNNIIDIFEKKIQSKLDFIWGK